MLDKFIIYATDFNDVILEEAKHGIYSIDAINKVNLLEMDLAII